MEWVIVALLLLWLITSRYAYGTLYVGPGEGTVLIHTGFKPKRVRVRLISDPVPGCSQLEDFVEVQNVTNSGFIIKYKVESGLGKIKWWARK